MRRPWPATGLGQRPRRYLARSAASSSRVLLPDTDAERGLPDELPFDVHRRGGRYRHRAMADSHGERALVLGRGGLR